MEAKRIASLVEPYDKKELKRLMNIDLTPESAWMNMLQGNFSPEVLEKIPEMKGIDPATLQTIFMRFQENLLKQQFRDAGKEEPNTGENKDVPPKRRKPTPLQAS